MFVKQWNFQFLSCPVHRGRIWRKARHTQTHIKGSKTASEINVTKENDTFLCLLFVFWYFYGNCWNHNSPISGTSRALFRKGGDGWKSECEQSSYIVSRYVRARFRQQHWNNRNTEIYKRWIEFLFTFMIKAKTKSLDVIFSFWFLTVSAEEAKYNTRKTYIRMHVWQKVKFLCLCFMAWCDLFCFPVRCRTNHIDSWRSR